MGERARGKEKLKLKLILILILIDEERVRPGGASQSTININQQSTINEIKIILISFDLVDLLN